LETIPVDDAYLDNFKRVNVQDPGIKVVVDAGNGAAGPVGLRALRGSGLSPIALFCRMDGSFPNHPPDPKVPANLEALVAKVKEQGATLGVAWDGDGDRLGVVDATGDIVSSDKLLSLFARDVLRESPGAAVVCDATCPQSVVDDIRSRGGRIVRTSAGYGLMRANMIEEDALLAGATSGHFFFRDRHFGFDDGIYTALRLLEFVAREGKTVVELMADLEAER
jgi:phosphomannomutase/phosphoglucomutase